MGFREVSMVDHKGDQGFVALLIEDACPSYGERDGKGLVNTRMYDLKQELRSWFPGRYTIHASQTAAEARRDIGLLFG